MNLLIEGTALVFASSDVAVNGPFPASREDDSVTLKGGSAAEPIAGGVFSGEPVGGFGVAPCGEGRQDCGDHDECDVGFHW